MIIYTVFNFYKISLTLNVVMAKNHVAVAHPHPDSLYSPCNPLR